MAITLDSATVRAGERLTGRLTGDGNRSEIEFARVETGIRNKSRSRSTMITAHPDAVSGEFSLVVPPDAAPTLRGRRINVEWAVQASRGPLRAPDQAKVQVLPAAGSKELPIRYLPGARPPMIRQLRREHYLSMGMGTAFASMWLALAIFINTADSEASAQATLNITIGAVVVAAFPLAALYLAARTIWPKSVAGFEPQIDPMLAAPGSTITISSDDPWPDDLRFLCVETYHRTYGAGPTWTSHKRTQFETFEHSESPLVTDTGTMSFAIPADAAPSFDGEQAQIRWVVRRGGRKIGRWGPIKVREWGIVVT